MEKYEWQQMRRDEIAEMRDHDAVVILPIGSIEQHGPHLPVNTDIFMAQTVALAAAQALSPDVPVLVAPPLWTGVSPHHMHFTGTLTLSVDTFSRSDPRDRNLRVAAWIPAHIATERAWRQRPNNESDDSQTRRRRHRSGRGDLLGPGSGRNCGTGRGGAQECRPRL